MTVIAIAVLAAVTYAIRLAGPLLRERVHLSDTVKRLLNTSATTLLLALVATATVTEGQSFAGWARPAGVLVGAVLSWRRAPFAVAVLAAAATAALLRLAGVA
ncbi:MAG TPA: AzlD domain-containing protein [Stackebrandtia sp.]|jgi:branched-subunit amino acid transport protein|uniref:AzlD domain-containing protein n=1 Tax=Stackebrandtia sp. TaxID=2023065 RepID=UPI002D5DAB6E|nr:AzlD domain-containing protein [Stackebrandtia sp.]HZE40462.1 AzlD domain-containing protein [Stackebrandtia sp.]